MKKTALRCLCAVLSFLLLLPCFSMVILAAPKTTVSRVVATSNLDEVAVLYGKTTNLEFEITEGKPARFSQSWETCWEVYNEETGKWENYSGRFYPGTYRVFAQIRVDGEEARSYELDKNVTCTVDGEAWTLELLSIHYDFSCVFATSPEITIADDPSAVEPVDVEELYFQFQGYLAGKKFSESTLSPHLGSENKVEIVDTPIFVEIVDKNGDGVPDYMDSENPSEPPTADDVIKADMTYMMLFHIRPLSPYDLSVFDGENLHLSARATIPYSCFVNYDGESESYAVLVLLRPCLGKISFTESPKAVVGYYGEFGESVEVSWETDGAVTKYQLYKWDEESEWDVMPYTDVHSNRYIFSYDDGASAGRYRIEAILDGETVAISDEFTLSWKEIEPISLPIRIDASGAVGSKKPVPLSEYYPENEQYELETEVDFGINQWIDVETGFPVEAFEDGKQYAYTVVATPKAGYCFDLRLPPTQIGEEPVVPDAIRVYGIEWDKVENVYELDADVYAATFTFTYKEKTGIPEASESLLYEIVLDGSVLVGMETPKKIPDAVWAHEALTSCAPDCDCDAIPDMVKAEMGIWRNMSQNQPATAFVPDTGFTYVQYFHVKDGWKIPGIMNTFDVRLSDVGIETVQLMYHQELGMIGVMFGFVGNESEKIPAGEHICALKRVDAAGPTCTESGKLAHFACACGKTYADRYGMTEIDDLTEGQPSATGHRFEGAWYSDGESHWQECACGEKGNQASHSDGNGNGRCDVCDAEIGLHTHTYGDTYRHDEEGHWKECACGERSMEGEHADENENGSCDICGAEMADEGCGSSVSATFAVIALSAACGIAIVGKKKEE